MTAPIRRLSLEEWDRAWPRLEADGLEEPAYGGPLGRHLADGDYRLRHLLFDPSPAALRLWNFLLTEEDRLHDARAAGRRLVGAMKDLGTVPVLAYSLPGLTAFYPDGAWWTPCVMEMSDELLREADALGIDETFCPVRAMLGAFLTRRHFPIPDLLVCSAGAVCDDFSAIAQRLEGLGHPIHWWEMPHRRPPSPGEEAVRLPDGTAAPRILVDFVASELREVGRALERLSGRSLDAGLLAAGIGRANELRRLIRELRRTVFAAPAAPLPALEMLIAEMLAIHFCSDADEAPRVIDDLLAVARARVAAGDGVLPPDAVRICWVNPPADLRVMNLLEECGGRLCGTEFLFGHALDPIATDAPPYEALARTALADPMAGPARDRAARVVREAAAFGAEAVLVSRIPGASHCATEGAAIAAAVRAQLDLPCAEIEAPPISEPMAAALRTRLEALCETARSRRRTACGMPA